MPPILTSIAAGSARSFGLLKGGVFRFFAPLPAPPSLDASLQYLIVAGGGGGAGGAGGGGGGGGLLLGTITASASNTYNVAVGGGGGRGTFDGASGSSGGLSYFGPNGLTTLTAFGGGGARHDNRTSPVGGNGGSGAGGGYAHDNPPGVSLGGTAVPGQGNVGGNGYSLPGQYCGAGGGGAGGAGTDSGPNFAGYGGAALFSSLSGTSTAYSGGASGSVNTALPQNPMPGGSNGATGGNSAQFSSGTAGFTSQGGGGAAGSNQSGGSNGGSGVVILRIPSASNSTLGRVSVTGSPTFINAGGESVYRFTGAGTIRFFPRQAAIANVQIFHVWTGGTRAAEYSVQWSDDNVNWSNSFSGIITATSCGLFIGSITSSDSRLPKRYWRYNIGNATISHHPRISRIDLIDTSGLAWRVYTATGDNCSDSGGIFFSPTNNVGYIDLATTGVVT
jgi:hypothetical protein